jgi:hypothetical protein
MYMYCDANQIHACESIDLAQKIFPKKSVYQHELALDILLVESYFYI